MLRLYNTALLPLRVAVEAWAHLPRADAAKRREWAERCAHRLPAPSRGGIWIHGASVGEARIVGSLARGIRAARPELPLAVSAATVSGRARLPEPPVVDRAFFAALDFPAFSRRLLGALHPRAVVLVETELWPNLLHEATAAGVPVVVLNGRLSPRRMACYRKLSRLYRPLLERVAGLGAQSAEDAERFVSLGVPRDRLTVTGNVKYDLPLPEIGAAELRRRLGLDDGRPVVAAGSTAPGEEAAVLDAFARSRERHPTLLLLLAPRHLARVGEVERLARSRRFEVGRLSAIGAAGAGPLDVLIVDTMGELHALYQVACAAFVGGSLVPVGGHNLLEPAAVGVPVLFGPHTEHAAEAAATLEREGGGLRVQGSQDLGERFAELASNTELRTEIGRRAAGVVEGSRGALRRSLLLLFEVLDARQAPATLETP